MNERIFYLFYNLAHQNAFLDGLIVFLAVDFPIIVAMLAGLFLLFHHEVFKAENPFQVFMQKKKEILIVFFSGALAWTLAHLFKYILHAPRPIDSLLDLAVLFDKTGNGFPSGHAAFFMALAFSIFFTHKKAGYVFMFFALLIALARVAAGVHFPSDILGGFILGFLVAYSLKKLGAKYFKI